MDFMDVIEIPRIDNVRLNRQMFSEINGVYDQLVNHSLEGSICLTSHHMIFSPKQKTEEEIWLMHTLIDSLETKIRETKFHLLVKTKNFQIFLIDLPSAYVCQSVFKSLESLSNLTSDNMKLPFYMCGRHKIEPQDWKLYSVEAEFEKLFGKTNIEWRISEVNKNYSVCQSYPTKLIVPAKADDSTLVKSSQFRAGGRFPILSYYHTPTKSFMLRSSQPLLGSNNRRCKEDEMLLKSSLPIGKKGVIYDLRDANTLKGAASKGGGYETEANYPLWKRVNRHLDRHDQLHGSLGKLLEACLGDPNQYLSRLESSNWLQNLRQALYVACSIVDEICNKDSCILVHGWDGWDNTLVITSLVHILLSPEYRTVHGFETLIEKEWLEAGHPFARRCSKSAFGSSPARQEGPSFLLFLDCVRQLIDQFCLSFEFNEDFLVSLFDNAYASEYGTFLCSSKCDREKLELSTRTASLWSYINSTENLKTFLNPLYEPNDTVLWPSLYSQSLSVWSGLFLRHQRKENPIREAKAELLKKVEANRQARERVEKLRSEFIELQKVAINDGLIQSVSRAAVL